MAAYKNSVRRSNTEYQQIEEYVLEKALHLMKLEPEIYAYGFTKALQ